MQKRDTSVLFHTGITRRQQHLSREGVKLICDFRQNPKKYLTVKFELFYAETFVGNVLENWGNAL